MADHGQFVLDTHTQLFHQHDTSVLDTDFTDDFVEHSPLVAGDRAGLKKLVEDAGEGLKYENARVISDGDLVALHGKFTGLDENVLVGFDIYRVKDGKIAEHWDSLVPEAAPNESGRTQLDGPTDPDTSSDTEANRALVVEFFEKTLVGGNYSGFETYSKDGRFDQHSPDIADGVPAVIDFLEKLRDAGEGLEYDKIHRTVAQGDFVLTHSEGSIAGARHAYCELWRVEDGAIVELWDAISEVPTDDQAVHSHGVF